MEILIQMLVGLGLVIVGILIERYYISKKELIQKSTIIHESTDKILEGKNLEKLSPGTTIGNMKSMLGEPFKYKDEDWSLLKDMNNDRISTHVYLYNLKNCQLKVTSKNNISIDTVTVLAKYPNEIDLSDVFLGNELILGKSTINDEIIKNASKHRERRTMKDVVGIVETFIASPLYKTVTYFTDDVEKVFRYIEGNDVENLRKAIISGVCISKYMDDSDSFYIFMYELI